MKGAIGNAFILNLVITFMIIFFSLLIGSMAYSKAYKTKNYLLNVIDKYEREGKRSFNSASSTTDKTDWDNEVNEYLGKIGYIINNGSTNTCPDKSTKKDGKYQTWVTNENGRYLSKKYSYDLGWELLDEDRECTLYPKTVRAGKNDTTSTSINVFGLPKESETFIYLDRKLIKSGYVWGLQWDISVSGRTMKPGTHDVTVVQYMNDDPRENPVICLTRSFKLKRPR